jgi:hypothetical protein
LSPAAREQPVELSSALLQRDRLAGPATRSRRGLHRRVVRLHEPGHYPVAYFPVREFGMLGSAVNDANRLFVWQTADQFLIAAIVGGTGELPPAVPVDLAALVCGGRRDLEA